MSVREKDSPALYTRIQEQNLLRQYDLLSNCIEIGLEKGIESFDKYTLWALNYAAVANIAQFGGRYREEPILVGRHIPPHFKDVPGFMDRFSVRSVGRGLRQSTRQLGSHNAVRPPDVSDHRRYGGV